MTVNTEEARTITKGNTRTPYGMILTQDDQPIDLTGLTVAFTMRDSAGTAIVDADAENVTVQPTLAFTVDATSNWVKHNNTRVENGDQVILSNSGGALPAGLAASTRYFVIEKTPNAFKLAETPNGPVVDITGAGTGTHSYAIVGSVQYSFEPEDVANEGTYWVWFTVTESSKDDTFPVDGRKRKVVIVEAD